MRRERKITRLRQYDYREGGAYVVTICVHERRLAFSRIANGEMRLHPFGRIAQEDWLDVATHYPTVVLDEWSVMPNHLHGLLFIDTEAPPTPEQETELRQFGKPLSGSLSSVIGNYKSGVSRRIGRARGSKTEVWQGGFYDHIIRSDRDLQNQREYIRNNVANWPDDELNPHP